MHIVIAGGSGFLGTALVRTLSTEGHRLSVLTRALPVASTRHDPAAGVTRVGWLPDGTAGPWHTAIDGADAIVNLAGESLAGLRWTAAKKHRIRESRIYSTRSLAAAIKAAASPPRVLVSGSAVGYYGSRGDERVTESAPAGDDFAAQVCVEWEAEARHAESATTRVALLRTGIVLGRDGGILPQMSLPFRLFVGGPVGSGRQYVSWIHEADWVDLARLAIEREDVRGPLNATAPDPVTNRELSAAIGRALGRPSWLPAPAFAIRLLLGEMGDSLLLGSQRAVPAKALELGFEFRYAAVAEALKATLT